MGTSPHHHHPKQQQQKFPIQKVITRTLYCLLPLAILHLCFFPLLPFNRTTLPSPTHESKSTISIPFQGDVDLPQQPIISAQEEERTREVILETIPSSKEEETIQEVNPETFPKSQEGERTQEVNSETIPKSQDEERTQEAIPEAITLSKEKETSQEVNPEPNPSSKVEDITELVNPETIPSSQEEKTTQEVNQETVSSSQEKETAQEVNPEPNLSSKVEEIAELVNPENIPSSQEEKTTQEVNQETIPTSQEEVASEVINQEPRSSPQCDYSTGKWVPSTLAPLYNSSSCKTIKNGQNCAAHGRPDTGFLHWRWQPNACNLSQFSALEFLTLIQNKHLAFVGDSMARNQAESLLCLLSTAATPNLVFTSGEENKFRRYSFPTFNATVSLFWSPFLVSGVEKTLAVPYNKLYLDTPEPTWAGELDKLDMVVFSVGHWFLHPALFYDAGVFIGCHQCPDVKPEPNYKETGFFHVFRKAVRTAIGAAGLKVKRVVVTTFSPAHFEGEWDSAGACRRTEPYPGDRQLEYMDDEMRKVEVEEVAKVAENGGEGLQIAALDITRMASLRPDGHPGPYMNPNPFFEGVKERVQNDCVHWCLPGPIDAWNEVLLAVMKRWEEEM